VLRHGEDLGGEAVLDNLLAAHDDQTLNPTAREMVSSAWRTRGRRHWSESYGRSYL
jgi:hypothetical protein